MVVPDEAGAVTVTVFQGFGAAAAKIARVEKTTALENIMLRNLGDFEWVGLGC
jgi:hypothetical protein